MKKIEVVAYSPLWKDEFEKAEEAYTKLFEGLEFSIEHEGAHQSKDYGLNQY